MQFDRITHDPAVMAGKPCIRGLRVTAGMVIGLLASGQSRERILQAHPYMADEMIGNAVPVKLAEHLGKAVIGYEKMRGKEAGNGTVPQLAG